MGVTGRPQTDPPACFFAAPADKLVAVIDKLDGKYGTLGFEPDFWSTNGQPKKLRDYVAAGGIAPLVHIAVAGWPKDGNLAASTHRYDRVTDVGAAAVQHELDPMEMEMSPMEQECGGARAQGPKWRSPRRRAIQALQAMSHYGCVEDSPA